MTEGGIRPLLSNVMLQFYRTTSQRELLLSFYEKLKTGGRPDLRTFTTVLSFHADVEDTEGMLRVLEDIKAAGFDADPWVTTVTLRYMAKSRNFEGVLKGFEKALETGRDIGSLASTVLDLLSNAESSQLQRALDLIIAGEISLGEDLQFQNRIIGKIFQRLKQERSFTTLVNLFKIKELAFGSTRANELLRVLIDEDRDGQNLPRFYEHMLKHKIVLDSNLIEPLAIALLDSGRADLADDLIGNIRKKDQALKHFAVAGKRKVILAIIKDLEADHAREICHQAILGLAYAEESEAPVYLILQCMEEVNVTPAPETFTEASFIALKKRQLESGLYIFKLLKKANMITSHKTYWNIAKLIITERGPEDVLEDVVAEARFKAGISVPFEAVSNCSVMYYIRQRSRPDRICPASYRS
eukprot:TRINITY_DN5405_c0_g2_i1.p1 TRINITY_DN5405_c0_g2~~TRINITY_DN5405_c0_g2_i1.p1  ORF type:complete len:414 (+),score=47.66 TRINITY_DN5405_c0_g2_i1:309-1550(+)